MQMLKTIVAEHPPEIQLQVKRALETMRDVVKVDRSTCLAYCEAASESGLELPLNFESFPDADLLELTALAWTIKARKVGPHRLTEYGYAV